VCTCSNEVCTRSTSACTCWCVGVNCAHTHLEAGMCSPGSVHMLNWSVRTLNRSVHTLRWGVHKVPDSEGRARVAGPDPACLRYTKRALSVIASVGRSVTWDDSGNNKEFQRSWETLKSSHNVSKPKRVRDSRRTRCPVVFHTSRWRAHVW
jgi:hypothetical protein